MSERRACSLVAADRKMIRYRSRRTPDTELRACLHELANQRRRFGYRRLYILLRGEGEAPGINRIYRLYRDEGLAVRKRWHEQPAMAARLKQNGLRQSPGGSGRAAPNCRIAYRLSASPRAGRSAEGAWPVPTDRPVMSAVNCEI
jgi:HTH-like domain